MIDDASRRGALATVFLVVLVDLLGFGIVLPLLPFYASRFGASSVSVGLLYSVYSGAQLVASPMWGALSDRVGRKPVMLVSTFGSALSYVIFAFAGSFPVLVASRLIAGAMGGNISTAQAYIADVTPPERRAQGMGLIGAAFGIGFLLGPVSSVAMVHPSVSSGVGALWPQAGSWLAENRYALPGLFAAALSAVSFALVCTRLPETVTAAERRPEREPSRKSVFSGSFWSDAAGVGSAHPGRTRALMLCALLIALGHSSLYSAFPLFCKDALSLPVEQVGLQFAWMGLLAVTVQGGLIRPLVRRHGEGRLFVWGCALMIIGLALLPFSKGIPALSATLGLLTIGASLNGPTLNSLLSQESGTERVGATMGAAQGLSAMGRMIGPTWGGALFALWPKAPFLATAAVLTLTLALRPRPARK